MSIPWSKQELYDEYMDSNRTIAKLLSENGKLQQQMEAIKEAYSMSGHSFDEICILVIENGVSGKELKNKLAELRAYDKKING